MPEVAFVFRHRMGDLRAVHGPGVLLKAIVSVPRPHEPSAASILVIPMEFIPHEIDQDVFVLLADGGINRQNAQQFTDDVETMVRNGFNKLIIDCSKLEYISSSGLGALLMLRKRMKTAGGDVKLCSVKGLVVQALQVMKLDRMLGVYPDMGQARLAFRSQSEDTDSHEPASGGS